MMGTLPDLGIGAWGRFFDRISEAVRNSRLFITEKAKMWAAYKKGEKDAYREMRRASRRAARSVAEDVKGIEGLTDEEIDARIDG